MTDLQMFNLVPVMPEILIAIMAMFLLVFGVFNGNKTYKAVTWYAVFTLVAAGGMLLKFPEMTVFAMNGMFVTEPFAAFMKLLVIIGASLSLLMSIAYCQRENIAKFEYPILIMFSSLGMMIMISANDLMSLYVGLELQSLPLYILAAFNRNNLKSSEAGIKYFVLGAISSGLLLYGCSMVYGFAGTTNFISIASSLTDEGSQLTGVIVGLVFIISGLMFKISAVPFHMWAPDVYEGAPKSVAAFFAIVPKIAAMGLIVRVLMETFGSMHSEWSQVLILISIGSMIVGAFAAIVQKNIIRLMAYSSIGHMGYALIAIISGTVQGIEALVIYMIIYMLTTAGVFAIILLMVRKNIQVETIHDLAGLAKYRPLMAVCMTILMFSMAGIPPLAGFFGKLFIFQAAIEQQLYTLAIIGVMTSVIGAYYYLRIIKIMYFDDAQEQLDDVRDYMSSFVMKLSALFAVIFIAIVWPIMGAVSFIVESLLLI